MKCQHRNPLGTCMLCNERARIAKVEPSKAPHEIPASLTAFQIVKVLEHMSPISDGDEVVDHERDWIVARYAELKRRYGFEASSERARQEWLEMYLRTWGAPSPQASRIEHFPAHGLSVEYIPLEDTGESLSEGSAGIGGDYQPEQENPP